MSNTEPDPAERTVCDGPPTGTAEPRADLLEPRDVPLGGPRAMRVRRTLPHRDLRMVGAWCFVDSYGPTDLGGGPGMQVPPHPHIGLQTVSWLLDGEILHQDSLGNARLVRPGQLNLMTAGGGIAHSEQTPAEHSPVLHGVQLWIAQPERDRNGPAHFEQHADLPVLTEDGGRITVINGELGGATSPARTCTPLVGAEIALRPGGRVRLPLRPDFEHAVLALSDPVEVDGTALTTGSLLHLGEGRREVLLSAESASRALLIGGAPFDEELVMWWNFVARTHEEVVEARRDWEAERTGPSPDRFGAVPGYDGAALPAPEPPRARLRARPRARHLER
ncbi:pirin family protein [Saccharopolyspora gregorii]|uniref:pirin family protein n=1 Tax=Saccharopolyspora gregorii TaxID=33914 RepID=UPI0021AC7DD7|nr:pirin family protein [Saccharopolyspora gregorii]